MGLYTNYVNESYGMAYDTDYRDYEPYKNEHVNFMALGIEVTSECAANSNAFMKAIALEELACFEQTGDTEAFYESVSIKGIFEKIKAIFKKIIDKIQKIFHTFIAKLGSMFQSSKGFAKKYRTEIIKNWSKVDKDWEFKGYKFTGIPNESAATAVKTLDAQKNKVFGEICKQVIKGEADATTKISELISAVEPSTFATTMKEIATNVAAGSGTSWTFDGKNYNNWNKVVTIANSSLKNSFQLTPGKNQIDELNKRLSDEGLSTIEANSTSSSTPKSADDILSAINSYRSNINEKSDEIRAEVLKRATATGGCKRYTGSSLDSKEFSEEIFKAFRNGEDDKEDLNKTAIESAYGSISGLITNIEEFDKTKKALETGTKNFTKSIDDLIKAIDKAQDELVKENKDTTDTDKTKLNEAYVAMGSLYQTYWEKIKEYQIQFYTGQLQAVKDNYSQAKAIAVKTIGLSKKMTTNESYDVSSSYDAGSSFIDSIQLV